MGRDSLGHGHNAGEQGNPDHGKGGLFIGGGGGSDSGGGHTSAGARVAFAERAKLKAHPPKGAPEAKVKATKATKAAAGRGDHQRAQSHSGRGYPVTTHGGVHSVGTHRGSGGVSSGGSGGGGGGGGLGIGQGHGGRFATAKGQAKKEQVAKGKAVDARHYPGEPDSQTIQFGRGTNTPATKKAYARRPSGRHS